MITREIGFGLDSFGEVSAESSGRLLNDAETVRLMADEVLAESSESTRTTLASTTDTGTSSRQLP